MGRPSLYTPEIVTQICNRLSQGEPLEQICRSENMPAATTVYEWANNSVESVPCSVSVDIARARDVGFDAIATNARLTARGLGESQQDIQRDKLIIETDLKLLSKWSKKYGDKITQEQTGAGGGAVQHNHTVTYIGSDKPPSPAEAITASLSQKV